jgi:hypothetical protein
LWLLSDHFKAVPEGQVVAIVDDYEITTNDLATEARALGISIASERAQRALLESIVDRQVLLKTAVEKGLDRTPQFQAERRRAEQMLLARLALEEEASAVQQARPEAVRRFVTYNQAFFDERYKLTLDQIRFTPTTALSAQEIAAIETIEAGEDQLRSKGIKFDRGITLVDTISLRPEAASRIVRISNGDIFHLTERAVGVLSKVIARDHLPVSEPERLVIAGRLLRERAATEAFRELVRAKRAELNIRYQKGFAPKDLPRGDGITPEVG